MSFYPDYYKSIIEHCVDLYKTTGSSDKKEAILRNIVSRSYYTCFLHCRDKLKQSGMSFNAANIDSHEEVIRELPQGLKNQLNQLKKFRRKADYDTQTVLSFPFSGNKGRGSIVLRSPEDFLNKVKTILSYDCTT